MSGRIAPLELRPGLDRALPTTLAEAIADIEPDATVAVDLRGRLTYGELRARAEAVAAALAVDDRSPVAVLVHPGAPAVVALTGAARAGRPYALLDPGAPAHWRAGLGARLSTSTVVVDETTTDLAAGLPGRRLRLDDVLREVVGGRGGSVDPERRFPQVQADDALFVSWTSGSSGIPKGVVHTHRTALTNACRVQQAFGIGPSDRLLVVSPLGYVGAATPVTTALVSGASIALYVLATEGAAGLPAFVAGTRPTVVQLTPGHVRAFADRVVAPSVRLVLVGGDRLTGADVTAIAAAFPAARIVHRYNASEANWIAGGQLRADGWRSDEAVPLGWPVPWLQVDVVADDGHPVQTGEPGEVVVAGDALSAGYWGDAAATDAVFETAAGMRRCRPGDRVVADEHGLLSFAGRSSRTEKVGSVLVDLDEVEQALATLPEVQEAAVIVLRPEGRPARLAAFVTGSARTGARVRRAAAEYLPTAMLPGAVTVMSSLPRNARGKVDYAALAAALPAPSTTPTRGAREHVIADAFARVLGQETVGRDDDLFDLGADSLDVQELIEILGPLLDRPLTTSVLLAAPTPALLAAVPSAVDGDGLIEVGTGPGVPLVVVPGGGGGEGALEAALGRAIGGRRVLVPIAHGYEHRGRPDRTVEAMGARVAGQVARRLGTGSVVLAGYSSGGAVAVEAAHRLADRGLDIRLVVLLDASAPRTTTDEQREAWWARREEEVRQVVGGRLGARTTRLLARVRPRRTVRVATAGFVRRSPALQQEIFHVLRSRAVARYRPRPYDGAVAAVLAATRPDGTELAGTGLADGDGSAEVAGWGALLGRAPVAYVVPGSHVTILEEQHRSTTAAQVRRLLDGVDAADTRLRSDG